MEKFNINFNNGNDSLSDNNLKGGIRKEIINDNKMLSIFNSLDDGNNILENHEIDKFKNLIVQFAGEDGEKTSLSNSEAKHLLQSLNVNVKVKDLFAFLGFLKTEASHIKTCETNQDTKEVKITYNESDNYTRIHDSKGNLVKELYYHRDGKTLKEEIIYENGIRISKEYDVNGKLISQKSAKPDGYVGPSKQGGNDCYLLAVINGIRLTDKGQDMLNKLVKKEGNKYTVKLPGAIKAAHAMKQDARFKNGVYITGVYTFTEAEAENLLKQAGSRYSEGDPDTILLEAAYERYREESNKTLLCNHINTAEECNFDNEVGFENCNPSDPLAGGKAYDAIYILTGISSDYYFTSQNNTMSYKEITNYDNVVAAGLPKNVNHEYNSKQDLNKILDKIMRDGDDGHIDNIVTCSVNTEMGGHALTVKTVTKDGKVVLINPWEPEKTITMSREEFIKKVYALTIATIP